MGCGNDRAHHFDPPDPERQHAAPLAATAERTLEPGTQDEPQKDQHLTEAIRERRGTLSRSGGGITEAENHLENAQNLFRSTEPPLPSSGGRIPRND